MVDKGSTQFPATDSLSLSRTGLFRSLTEFDHPTYLRKPMRSCLIVVPLVSLAACSTSTPDEARRPNSSVMAQADLSRPVASVAGFIRPEAVRYDPDQDVYFVNSWGLGPSGAKDNNGFISRMAPDGTVCLLYTSPSPRDS